MNGMRAAIVAALLAAAATPDVALRKHTLAPLLRVGDAADAWLLSVENVGGASTSGPVTITDALPTGFNFDPDAFLSAHGTDGIGATVDDTGLLTITIDRELAPGADIGVAVPVILSEIGIARNSADASASGDVEAANDHAVADGPITVFPPRQDGHLFRIDDDPEANVLRR
jgi:hypothetical protein